MRTLEKNTRTHRFDTAPPRGDRNGSWRRYDVTAPASRYRARHKNVDQDAKERKGKTGNITINARNNVSVQMDDAYVCVTMITFRYILSAMIIKIRKRDIDKDANLLMYNKRFPERNWKSGT